MADESLNLQKLLEEKKKRDALRREYYKTYNMKRNKTFRFLNDHKEMVFEILRTHDFYDAVAMLNIYMLQHPEEIEKYGFSPKIRVFFKVRDIENFLFLLEKDEDSLLKKFMKDLENKNG